jgi:hypothetical protein
MICAHLPEFFLPNYIYRATEHIAILFKARFIHLGLNFTQHSNTPVLQHSGTILSTKPLFLNLAPRTKFSILE